MPEPNHSALTVVQILVLSCVLYLALFHAFLFVRRRKAQHNRDLLAELLRSRAAASGPSPLGLHDEALLYSPSLTSSASPSPYDDASPEQTDLDLSSSTASFPTTELHSHSSTSLPATSSSSSSSTTTSSASSSTATTNPAIPDRSEG